MVKVTELVYYPVKGCAGTSVPDAVLLPAGLEHDRSFMVVDADGTFRSQRRDPSMAVIRPEVSPDGRRLTLRAPGAGDAEIDIEVDMSAPRVDVALFGRPYRGIDQGDDVAAWLSEVLGTESRLVRVPPEHERVTSGRTPGTAGYADGQALLITSLSSLDDLNARITEGGGDPVPMDRFRPNIIVDDLGAPFAEDEIRTATVGAAEVGYAKLDIRCAVTTVDQTAGRRAGPEPLRTLARYRRAAEGGVAFGVKAAVLRPGKLSVGDELIVTSRGESEL